MYTFRFLAGKEDLNSADHSNDRHFIAAAPRPFFLTTKPRIYHNQDLAAEKCVGY